MAARVEDTIDWAQPNYAAIFAARVERLNRIARLKPTALAALKQYYRENPWDFVSDYGLTFDPRNTEVPVLPFLLFPKQREFMQWTIARWHAGDWGLLEKSRDSGATWCAVALACTLCLFYDNLVIGFGSRKEVYVDNSGDPKSIFYKARFFLEHLPAVFRGGWQREKHAAHMRVYFPNSHSAITGEAGDGIGRGDRTAIYFVDEAAFLERPQLTDASLSQTTRCRIDISTPNGMANPFAQKRHGGKYPVFTLHWRDDKRKSEEWYAKQVANISSSVILNQELNIGYYGSVEGQVIPADWVQAAIGAAEKLGIERTGLQRGGLDVADEGDALNAFAGRHGNALTVLKQWTGKGSDIYTTVERAFALCDELGLEGFDYDADGVGAGVRGDAQRINAARKEAGNRWINDAPFRGSAAPHDPDGSLVAERANKDFFANAKASAWWSLRIRFQNVYRWVVEGLPPTDPDDIITIPADLDNINLLMMELAQPVYKINTAGKVVIEKTPEGAKSPNLADAVMICFNPASAWMNIWEKLGK